MKDRDFRLGDINVKISDLGLDCYWIDFETKEKHHMWLNNIGLNELIKIGEMNDFQYEVYVQKSERKKKLRKISNRT